MIYLYLKHSHSVIRWIVLVLVVYSVVVAAKSIMANEKYTKGDKIRNMLATYFAHIQLLVGFILYFISSKVVFSFDSLRNPTLRFFLVEHLLGMIIAIALITIGHAQSKRLKLDKSKHMQVFIYFLIAAVLLCLSIPWPWNDFGTSWY